MCVAACPSSSDTSARRALAAVPSRAASSVIGARRGVIMFLNRRVTHPGATDGPEGDCSPVRSPIGTPGE